MKEIPPECKEDNSNLKILMEEKRSKVVFLNPDRRAVTKIKVDGCAIRDNKILRCDYALIPKDNDRIEIYIELKGSDVNHAFKQIESTIRELSENPNKLKKICIIVATSISPKLRSGMQNQKAIFKKKFNADLHIEKTPYEYDLQDLGF